MRPREMLTTGLGTAVGGLAYAGSAVRGARVFHAEGELYRAEVEPAGAFPGSLSQQLAGTALVRLSAALWRGQRERPDIMGAAIRFGWDPDAPLKTAGVQDLLLITSSRFWSIPASLLSTDPSDYLSNTYYSIVSFGTELGEMEFRLVPQRGGHFDGSTRAERLADAVANGLALFTLQARPAQRPLKLLRETQPWQQIVRIRLVERAIVNERELLFTPFHADRGIEPTGTANGIRRRTYPRSKAGRS